MVTARFVGGKVVTDCPKCDLRASLHANGPTTLLCPHERLAVLLISAQRAKLVQSETVADEFKGEFTLLSSCDHEFCCIFLVLMYLVQTEFLTNSCIVCVSLCQRPTLYMFIARVHHLDLRFATSCLRYVH